MLYSLFIHFCVLPFLSAFFVPALHKACNSLSYICMNSDSSRVKSGFGFSKPVKVPVSTDAMTSLESIIQNRIDAEPGLRESMSLYDELRQFDIVVSSMSSVEQSIRIPPQQLQAIQRKRERAKELQLQYGLSHLAVHNKLQEITWDAAAASRHHRHQEAQSAPKTNSNKAKKTPPLRVSDAMTAHMLSLAEWAVGMDTNSHESDKTRFILDVGCGTGLLCNYLKQFTSSTSNSNSGSSNTNNNKKKVSTSSSALHASIDRAADDSSSQSVSVKVFGVDFSGEMVKIAQESHPDATFVQTDFLQYIPPPEVGSFDRIIFNESLHNFLNVEDTLRYAATLLNTKTGRILLSNPKGFAGIVTQRAVNQWLSPSLLPNSQELELLADQLNLQLLRAPDTTSPHYLAVLATR